MSSCFAPLIVFEQIVFQRPASQDPGSRANISSDTASSPAQKQRKFHAVQPPPVVSSDSNAQQQKSDMHDSSRLASARELAQRVNPPALPPLPSLPDVDSLLGGPLSGEASKKRSLPNPNIPPPPSSKVAKQASGMPGRHDEASRLLPPQLRGR